MPRSADTAADYLPLTGRNLISQAFKFLGERYGWGHSYDTRDCSGFVSEIYRSFGILLPRNTSSQGISPALDRIAFDNDSSSASRQAAVDGLQPGDLVFIPGHVMMTIGKVDGMTWMIHDTNGGSFFGFKDVQEKKWDSPYKDWFHLSFDGNSDYNDGFWYSVRICWEMLHMRRSPMMLMSKP